MGQAPKTHTYQVGVVWIGNMGRGTADYRAYERAHEIRVDQKPVIPGSADPAFRGDRTRYNPEEMLVASLSTCHMLWYLHLCATAGVVVTAYVDHPIGTMAEVNNGSGHFTEVVLKPEITLATGDTATAAQLHDQAHHLCFIANSVNFPVRCEPTIHSPT